MEMFILAIVALGLGAGTGWFLQKQLFVNKTKQLEEESEKLLDQAKLAAENIKKEAEISAKEKALQTQSELESKMDTKKREIEKIEKRLLQRELSLDEKLEQLDRQEKSLDDKRQSIEKLESGLNEKISESNKIIESQKQKLQELSGLSADQAKEELKNSLLEETRLESTNNIKKIEEETNKTALEKARYIIAQAVQRHSSDYAAENTVSVVDLPNDEMKGRIIGREGRNIRALEVATGVDIIIDDTPNAVILSCFDLVKREIARQTLEKLIHDGRIHPGRIEDTVEKVTAELDEQMQKEGEKACFELGLDRIHPELIKLLGRLRYRTSYSQNVLAHSVEVGFLCGMMAAELGQNVKLARRAGLLHDIGKALDHNLEGSHTQIGFDVARRYNEPKVVLNSIASHHEDVPADSIISILVAASDALSASRPGARKEMLQTYIKRMQKLEEIGDSFNGVGRTYAIQAGREVRVVVEPETIHDNEAFFLAKDIARKIENELAYPGEIKVTVIRETRSTECAK